MTKKEMEAHARVRFQLSVFHNADWDASLNHAHELEHPWSGVHSLIHVYDTENETNYGHWDLDHRDFPHSKVEVFGNKLILMTKSLDQAPRILEVIRNILIPRKGELLKLSDSKLIWSHPDEFRTILESVAKPQGYVPRVDRPLVKTNFRKAPSDPIPSASVPVVMSMIGFSGPDFADNREKKNSQRPRKT